MINRAVIGLRALRDAIGSEWTLGVNSVQIVSVDAVNYRVKLSNGQEVPVIQFLKTWKPAIPKDQIPTWYARLLEDKLL